MSDELFPSEFFAPEAEWHMVAAERCALLYILQQLKPDVSIEIGTARGGSLRPIARYSKKVHSFDIIAEQHHRLRPLFPDVNFVTGDTRETLPATIDALNKSDDEVGFILVDGSHEAEGVYSDLVHCLRYIPKTRTTAILMHDSCNPSVRQGIKKVDWSANPYLHALDIDFVPGVLYGPGRIYNQLWGGLALAVLKPEKRTADPSFAHLFQHSYETLLKHSVHVDAPAKAE